MVLLISYDLVGHERPSAYEGVKAYLEKHAISFRRPLFSQWLVETRSSPQQWVDALRSGELIDRNDRLLVVRVRRPYHGSLPPETWEWLRARLN